MSKSADAALFLYNTRFRDDADPSPFAYKQGYYAGLQSMFDLQRTITAFNGRDTAEREAFIAGLEDGKLHARLWLQANRHAPITQPSTAA